MTNNCSPLANQTLDRPRERSTQVLFNESQFLYWFVGTSKPGLLCCLIYLVKPIVFQTDLNCNKFTYLICLDFLKILYKYLSSCSSFLDYLVIWIVTPTAGAFLLSCPQLFSKVFALWKRSSPTLTATNWFVNQLRNLLYVWSRRKTTSVLSGNEILSTFSPTSSWATLSRSYRRSGPTIWLRTLRMDSSTFFFFVELSTHLLYALICNEHHILNNSKQTPSKLHLQHYQHPTGWWSSKRLGIAHKQSQLPHKPLQRNCFAWWA